MVSFEFGINDAKKAWKEEAWERGRDSTMVNNIRNLIETSGWNAQQTMDALKIPADEQERYTKLI